jgi:hypothetical protein
VLQEALCAEPGVAVPKTVVVDSVAAEVAEGVEAIVVGVVVACIAVGVDDGGRLSGVLDA